MFDEWTTEDAAIKFFKEGYGSSKNIPDNLNDRSEDRVLGNKKWSKNNIKAEYISEDECGRELEFGFWKVQVVFKGVSDITVRNNSLRVKDIVIGRGQAPKKDQAEQLACEDAINYLNKDKENVILTKLGGVRKEHKYTIKGIYKTIDPIYEEINKLPNREVEEVKDVVNFEKMKRPELIDYCKKHKIKGYSNKKKKDIIELINNKI